MQRKKSCLNFVESRKQREQKRKVVFFGRRKRRWNNLEMEMKTVAVLTDVIESFIKEMLNRETQVELKRNELATFFDCAPSQINYVLTSRFTFENGYMTESKRGGGGYIRIIRLKENENHDFLINLVSEKLAQGISEKTAMRIVAALVERNILGEREGRIISVVISDHTLGIPSQDMRDILRARILKSVVMKILNENQ